MAKKQPTTKRKTAKRKPVPLILIDHETMKAYITECLREMDPLPEFRKPKPSPKAKPKAVADEPRVTGPHGGNGGWDIRTNTHFFASGYEGVWARRTPECDQVGAYDTAGDAKKDLPAARKAWAEMKNGGAK